MKFNTKPCEEKMQKSVAAYESNLSTIRASQANSAVVSKVTFEYYGAPTRLVDMASVAVTDPKTLTITPYDRSTLKAMVKAILASDIGITPADDGSVIRLIFPQLTEEHRKSLAKQIVKMAEDARVAIRNIRRDANDDIKKQKKDGEMTEDEQKISEKSVQDLTDKYIKQIDEISAKKEKEIMQL
ncbi:MAG: ribosome recycling factor [Ruminococcaceae bacterium]|nr:ribosome recycling factor [Oscillospiraceae bacterium]